MDLQCPLCKWDVIFTDNSLLYLVIYLIVSLLGNANYFFFSCHLLDAAISFKTLATVVQAVTHNGKQCFISHLHTGLRVGGRIGEEIEPPNGDAHEALRILLDMSFFLLVIIIFLEIIQGLIIDAFGDLRDQLEQVKEDLESKCFICGIGRECFNATPYGFDRHAERGHNFANHMYFLMHLINKRDTEFTGQETYAWQLYQQRRPDFSHRKLFPQAVRRGIACAVVPRDASTPRSSDAAF